MVWAVALRAADTSAGATSVLAWRTTQDAAVMRRRLRHGLTAGGLAMARTVSQGRSGCLTARRRLLPPGWVR
jgi:hypothetical protein